MPWTDDFNRADGAVDNGWTDRGASCSISGGYPTASGTAFIVREFAGSDGAQTVEAQFDRQGNTGYTSRLVVKCDAGADDYYYATINTASDFFVAYIYEVNGGTPTQLAGQTINVPPGASPILAFSYSGGSLSLSVNGTVRATASDSTHGANTWCGLYNPNLTIRTDYFTIEQGVTASMAITPDPVWVGGGLIQMLATGTDTGWDPNNQGDTTLSADHGTIAAANIDSATQITFYYAPDDYLGPITFTETKYGLQDTIDGTVVPPEGSGGNVCPFDADFIATANATVLADNRGLPTLESVIVPAAHGWSDVYLQEALADIWYSHFRPEDLDPAHQQGEDRLAILWQILNGTVSPPVGPFTTPPAEPIHNTIQAALDSIAAMRTTGDMTLADVVVAIQGTPTYTLAHIHDDIDAIVTGSNQDVLDALAAYFGANPPTIEQLGTMISDIATIAGYTLGDVLDAIADTQTAVASVGTTVSTISTNVTNGFQAVLDAIAAIPTVEPTPGAPKWPGLSGVTLGEEVALVDQLVLAGPMDGCLVSVTVPPVGLGGYNVGGARLDYGQMRVAFVTDNGYTEPWQYFGFRQAIYTPQSMEQAASCRFQLAGGLGGTVRTFVRT